VQQQQLLTLGHQQTKAAAALFIAISRAQHARARASLAVAIKEIFDAFVSDTNTHPLTLDKHFQQIKIKTSLQHHQQHLLLSK